MDVKKMKKEINKILGLWTGLASIGLYWMLLSEQDLINDYFTRGSLYALLPIVTAFAFSMVHGSFTGRFWSVLGIEAAKKKMEVK